MQEVAEQVPQPPAPPAPPAQLPPGARATVTTSDAGAPLTVNITGPSPAAILQAKEQQREVLAEQMSRLLNRRQDVASQLQSPELGPAEKTALQDHYVALNGSIIQMEKAIQQADAEWAAAAGTPGATIQEPRGRNNDGGPPEEAYVVGASFMGIASVIMAIAYARRLWKGTSKVVAQIPAAFEHRFTRLEQSLDAVAIEIERVSEGQRFLTRVFAEQGQRPLGTGAAQPVEVHPGDRMSDPVRRS